MNHGLDNFRKRLEQKGDYCNSPVRVACLGDSLTHGVFEVEEGSDGQLMLTFDTEAVYHRRLGRLFEHFFPQSTFEIINAGQSGSTAINGLARIDSQVLVYQPDLCIVCFGLNDASIGLNELCAYTRAMGDIFSKLSKIPTILLTPCMMNTAVSPHLQGENLRRIACRCAETQNTGILDAYMKSAKQVATQYGIGICDEYARFQSWRANGIDTDGLLSNHINHPTREIHGLWAWDLFLLMVGQPCFFGGCETGPSGYRVKE